MAKKKSKTHEMYDEVASFIKSQCNDNFTLKTSLNEIADKVLEIEKMYFKKKKYDIRHENIIEIICYELVFKANRIRLSSLNYWDLVEIINKWFFRAKIELVSMIDSPHTEYMDNIKEVYLKATPGLEEFDNLVKTYMELSKLKKSGIDVNKFLEDTYNQLCSYPNNFYFKSPYFCNLLTEIIVEAGDKKEKNEKNRTC
ncbi:hypothetical protein [Fusobacterium vincentii ATCC 49256]|uniref:Uncharacterized protein n=1 Tax=Fusobacterium vincentii ATCC 49256 TaxID=209882 RepID=Q7P5S9_FUSVC|nr:hypothetical protein [Fusobacterium vincentii ATCC 49256]